MAKTHESAHIGERHIKLLQKYLKYVFSQKGVSQDSLHAADGNTRFMDSFSSHS